MMNRAEIFEKQKGKMKLYVFQDIEEEMQYSGRHCDLKATSKGLFDECKYIGKPNTLEGNSTTKHSQMKNIFQTHPVKRQMGKT